jgi:methylthioribose-1-phosphate isomerase
MVDTRSLLNTLRREGGSKVVPFRWEKRVLHLLDQRLLPTEERWLSYTSGQEVAEAIRDMVVRGAPAIGITAAFGMVLAARECAERAPDRFAEAFVQEAQVMEAARPTAVNLRWAVERMTGLLSGRSEASAHDLVSVMESEALSIWEEDVLANLAMGRLGQELLPEAGGVLTHCNAGALATGGYGTALGVIRAALSAGKNLRVMADETRPWLQGSRLTAWELLEDGIPVILIADSAAGFLMQLGEIDAVVVGADRIAANGDVANKIGTYGVAQLAKAHGIPFYVAAPVSTLDRGTPTGGDILIEERGGQEIVACAGQPVAPPGASARNPVFDVTPHHLVTAIVTERGVLRPPYGPAIHGCFA